jgi:hypothetical protein
VTVAGGVGQNLAQAAAEAFAIDPAKLRDVFVAEPPAQQAAVMGATQRP